LIIIDNYDSFTYNLVEYFRILGKNPLIYKNDKITLKELENLKFNHIVISPGWGSPKNSGISMDIIDRYHSSKKILGVCLGHQCICQYYGAKITKAKEPMHGKVSKIYFKENEKLFIGVKNPFNAVRYHSLIAVGLQTENLETIAVTANNEIMAVKAVKDNVYGVQFHPEAILTEYGLKILYNFLL